MLIPRILTCVAMLTSLAAWAQAAPVNPAPRPAPSPEQIARQAYTNALPDLPGTGPYPAEKEVVPSLPEHTIYHPTDLSKLADTRLGIVLFGNGGCSADGASARNHLLEIASHGYLAIAPGRIHSGPDSEPMPPREIDASTGLPRMQTSADDLLAALDWALEQNEDRKSPFYEKLDPEAVAVSGWSCGGLQALKIAPDPRIKAVIIHNSGIFPDDAQRLDFIDKSALVLLHTPVLYVLGGPADIAYANGVDDFSRIDKVPAVLANLQVGHSGTFAQVYGGRAAQVDVDWLQWQLHGDESAARTFTGPACRLCLDPTWTIQRKGFE